MTALGKITTKGLRPGTRILLTPTGVARLFTPAARKTGATVGTVSAVHAVRTTGARTVRFDVVTDAGTVAAVTASQTFWLAREATPVAVTPEAVAPSRVDLYWVPTPELVVGDIVHTHGMDVEILEPPRVHNSDQTDPPRKVFAWRGDVVNYAEVANKIVPASWISDGWTVQGNELARWHVSRLLSALPLCTCGQPAAPAMQLGIGNAGARSYVHAVGEVIAGKAGLWHRGAIVRHPATGDEVHPADAYLRPGAV